MVSEKFFDDEQIQWVTIKSSDNSYYRSFVGNRNDGVLTRLFGIKYTNDAAYQKYRDAYIAFKNSLKQYID
jgi:hypothetical protein